MKKIVVSIAAALVLSSISHADVYITEWMYDGANAEFIEFTNVGGSAVDFTGWSFDDDSRVPGTVSLSAFGIVNPGQSVVLAEASTSDFNTAWGLSGVSVIGSNTTNLGRNDEINLYDNTGTLVDRLTYGDQNFPGSIRTQGFSGNPATPGALGANDPLQWVFSSVGDTFGSHASTGGDVGNPGVYVPEPASFGLMLLGLSMLAFARRS